MILHLLFILVNILFLFLVRSKINATSSVVPRGAHPLLSSCLKGVGMFAHLIDLDFMADLLKHLKILASGTNSGHSESPLTVSERLECCIVAFKVMRKNLDALNVDLQDFFIQLYNLILEYRPGRWVLYMLFSFNFVMLFYHIYNASMAAWEDRYFADLIFLVLQCCIDLIFLISMPHTCLGV